MRAGDLTMFIPASLHMDKNKESLSSRLMDLSMDGTLMSIHMCVPG